MTFPCPIMKILSNVGGARELGKPRPRQLEQVLESKSCGGAGPCWGRVCSAVFLKTWGPGGGVHIQGVLEEGPWMGQTSIHVLVLSWSITISPAPPSLWGCWNDSQHSWQRRPDLPGELTRTSGPTHTWGEAGSPGTLQQWEMKRNSFLQPSSKNLNLVKQRFED